MHVTDGQTDRITTAKMVGASIARAVKINPAKSEIRLTFVLAVFCHEFEFSAKLRLTGKLSAEMQIILRQT